MINCKNISKAYDNQKVFDDFSYSFDETGFYLLYGISGSGKTTLLNILAGHLSFDGGTVECNGKEYKGQVDGAELESYVDYITQDTNFVDYLSVYDNLTLCSGDKERIDEYLKRFGLLDKKKMLPRKLSGGEKQRVCLVRSLIRGKRVILLDEPTAALDMENKILVFELLKELKKDVLIICSSHDEMAKRYADEYIDFNNKSKYKQKQIEMQNYTQHKTAELSKIKMRNPMPYIRKWFTSPLKNKASKVWFAIVMLLAFMVLCLGDTPSNKFKSSVEYIYGFNQLEVWATRKNAEYIESLYDRADINEIVIDYSGSVPYETEEIELPDELKEIIGDTSGENGYVSADYELDLWTLPVDKENFHLEDFLECGRYIENENEIILAHNAIPDGVNPENYIGTTRKIQLYDDEYIMTVVGVMKEPTLAQRQYLNASGVKVNDGTEGSYSATYAISAAITNKYIEDENFYSGINERCYYLYFDSYKDMKAFYDQTENGHGLVFVSPEVEYSLIDIFDIMNKYMYPIGIIVSIMAVVFYYQVQRTELLYNRKIFMVYQYLGYSIGKIKAMWLLFSVLDLIKAFAISMGMSFFVMYGINALNRDIKVISFEIFTYNLDVILKVFLAVVVTGILSAIFTLRKINIEKMSENLAKQRDLL